MEQPKYTLKEAEAARAVREPDQLLSMVAAIGGLDITFIVGGQLYSGRVLKHEKWLEALEQNGLPTEMVEAIKDLDEETEYPTEDTPLLEDDERPEHEIAEEQIKGIRQYLYILNLRQMTANGVNHHHGAAMRFLISEIQGWSFGSAENRPE